MAANLRVYESETIRVFYDPIRCIHAGRCVHRLRSVFDPDRRPWVDPTLADADEIAGVIARCPTGALRFERLDGGPAESPPGLNSVRIMPNGPAYVRGRLTLQHPDGSGSTGATRIALCRCGASSHQPFCDGSHMKVGFSDPGIVMREISSEPPPDGVLTITPRPNGSVLLEGPFQVVDGSRKVVGSLSRAGLCRCGLSQAKPFCDSRHKAAGFQTD